MSGRCAATHHTRARLAPWSEGHRLHGARAESRTAERALHTSFFKITRRMVKIASYQNPGSTFGQYHVQSCTRTKTNRRAAWLPARARECVDRVTHTCVNLPSFLRLPPPSVPFCPNVVGLDEWLIIQRGALTSASLLRL